MLGAWNVFDSKIDSVSLKSFSPLFIGQIENDILVIPTLNFKLNIFGRFFMPYFEFLQIWAKWSDLPVVFLSKVESSSLQLQNDYIGVFGFDSDMS